MKQSQAEDPLRKSFKKYFLSLKKKSTQALQGYDAGSY